MTDSKRNKSIIIFKIAFLLMFFMCSKTYAGKGTNTETLEWLKKKINKIGYSHHNFKSETLTREYKMTYDDKEIRIEYKKTKEDDDGDVSRWAFLYIIPIKEIAKIKTKSSDDMFMLRDTKKDKTSVVSIRSSGDTHKPFSVCYLESGELFEMNRKIELRFPYNKDLAQEIKKTFERLIK